MIESLHISLFALSVLLTVALVAGLVRGFTGGMGSNAILAPVLALMVGARDAVLMVILINVITSVQLVPGAAKLTRWREIAPMTAAGHLALPLGVYTLLNLDQELMRRAVAVTAIVLTVVLLTGWKYSGARGAGAAGCIGGIAGYLAGSVAIGGLPVTLYLLSGPDDAATNRAHFISFVTILQVASLTLFAANGVFSLEIIMRTLAMAVPYALTIWAGSVLFRYAGDKWLRRVAMGLVLAVSIGVLLA